MKNHLLIILLTIGHSTMAAKESTNISIYSKNQQGAIHPNQLQDPYSIPGFAMIRQNRSLDFSKGHTQLKFDEVTEYIDPTTVSLKLAEEDDEKLTIVDQNYQFDLVDNNKLLQKYIGEKITINHNLGDTSVNTAGTLLSTNGGLIIRQSNETIKTISAWNHITFNALPEGLLTRPTLVWQVESQLSGPHPVTVSYQSQGMTWWADYNITLNENNNECLMDLSAWVSVVNKSGASFEQSQLKLIAGEVNRVTPQQRPMAKMSRVQMQEDGGMVSEPLFEYHMYRLPHLVDLPNHSTKQVPLIASLTQLKCEKILTFNATNLNQVNYHQPITHSNYYQHSKANVTASLQFDNDKKNQLGIPFPAGRVRVNVHNPNDNSLEFVGEDTIEHTAKNETINLNLGQSFDVSGERTQKDFNAEKNSITETFEILMSNQKSQEVTVQIKEPMYRWSNWSIIESTHDFKKMNSNMIAFDIKLKPEDKIIVKYSVKYQWPEK